MLPSKALRFIAQKLVVASLFISVATFQLGGVADPVSQSWPSPPARTPDSPLVVVRFPTVELPHDPLRKVDSQNQIKGTIVYTPRIIVYPEQPANYFIVFHDLNKGKDFGGHVSTSAAYIASTDDHVFNPQYSPNGKKLLIEVGRPDLPYGGYKFFIWDIEKKVLLGNPDELLFPTLAWSPDSSAVAFVKGGDEQGNEFAGEISSPTHLCVFDLKRGTSTLVLQQTGVTRFAWTPTGDLLFVAPKQEVAGTTPTASHSAVYRVTPGTREPSKLIDDADTAVPSPDGKSVAFLGWFEDSSIDKARQARPAIYGIGIYNIASNTRTLVQPLPKARRGEGRFPIQLNWSDSSRALWWVDSSYQNGNGRTVINQLNLGSAAGGDALKINQPQPKSLATIQTVDSKETERGPASPAVRFVSSTRDGRFILLSVSQLNEINHGFATEQRSLVALNIENGALTTLAEVENKWGSVVGWDWHEDD